MKKSISLIFALTLTSFSAMADLGVVGNYSNGNKQCDLEVSIRDVHNVGRDSLVVSTSQNRITEWGANFNVEMRLLEQYGPCPKNLDIDNSMGPGFGADRIIRLKFDSVKCEITDYKLIFGTIANPIEELNCAGMIKKN